MREQAGSAKSLQESVTGVFEKSKKESVAPFENYKGESNMRSQRNKRERGGQIIQDSMRHFQNFGCCLRETGSHCKVFNELPDLPYVFKRSPLLSHCKVLKIPKGPKAFCLILNSYMDIQKLIKANIMICSSLYVLSYHFSSLGIWVT